MPSELMTAASDARGMSRSQKAAAILLAVGPDTAGQVLAHLNEAEVEHVALEVASLGSITPTGMSTILTEFKTEALAQQQLITGGETHARAILRNWTGNEDAADDIIDRLLAAALTAPFHFLRQHDSAVIVQHLHEEHPQTIALVLAYLPTKFAAAVLAGFEADLQSDVALRIATLEPASPEVVKRVEDAMRARMGGSARRSSREERGGVKELAQMLNNSDRGTERAILDSLEILQPELADEIRSLMFVFEDVIHFDDRTMQQLLRNVDMKLLAMAMKGVRNEIRELVFRNLSERAAIGLKEEIDLLGPVPIKDVEAAQSEIVGLIRKLEDEGVIVMARAGEGQFVE